MRKFSGITSIFLPEAAYSDNMPPVQMMVITEKDECTPGRTGMNIQPHKTEFRKTNK